MASFCARILHGTRVAHNCTFLGQDYCARPYYYTKPAARAVKETPVTNEPTLNVSAYIVIPAGRISLEDLSLPVDSGEQIETAQAALREAGLTEVPIYSGSPDCPDSYRSGRTLHAECRPIPRRKKVDCYVVSGNLCEYRTGRILRPATAWETEQSEQAAERDSGRGVFEAEVEAELE